MDDPHWFPRGLVDGADRPSGDKINGDWLSSPHDEETRLSGTVLRGKGVDYQWTPELLGERREREKSGWERYRGIETAGERERESWFVPRVFFCFRVFLLLFKGFSLRGVRSRCCGDILWIFFENWSVVIQVHLFFKEKNRQLLWFLGEYIRCFCCLFTFYIMLLFYGVYLHCLFIKDNTVYYCSWLVILLFS